MPTTMCLGSPQHFCSAQTMASSGLVMQMTKAFGRVFLDAGADLLHHLEIDAEKIVAAHAGLARHAGGDDADRGALDRFVGIGADDAGVEALDRSGLRKVERLAVRNTLHDVEKNDVTELLEPDQMRQRSADLTGTDQCNLVSRHRRKVLDWLDITWSMIFPKTGFHPDQVRALFGIMLYTPRLRGP